MEYNEQFIKDNGLSPEQVTAITTHSDDHIAVLKKEWDGKGNTDFEGIANGAAKSIYGSIGIEREKGEKIADFIMRAAKKQNETTLFEAKTAKTESEAAKAEYLEKSKNVQGSEGLTAEINDLKIKNDDLLKQYADFDAHKEGAEKYSELIVKHETMKEQVAFGQEEPNFPDTVNPYEAAAKWNEFKAKVLETNTIELVEGVSMLIDKDNPHKTKKLADAIKEDTALADLSKGRQQEGSGAQQTQKQAIDGVPFEVPVNASTKDRAEVIRTYLATKNLTPTSSEYSDLFMKFNTAIIKQQTAA